MKQLRFALVLLSMSTFVLGCEVETEDVVYSCDNPDIGHFDSKGNPDPCHLEEKGKPQSICMGGCEEISLAFERTIVALWVGPEGKEPACPKQAPKAVFNGYAGLTAPPMCAPCRCSEPSCVLPSVRATAGDACGGSVVGAVEPPPSWEGGCLAGPSLGPGTFSSVHIGAVGTAGCEVIEDPLPVPQFASAWPAQWAVAARACAAEEEESPPACAGAACVRGIEKLPAGFQRCLRYPEGTEESETQVCPAEFPERHVFYAGLSDTRECTACSCAPPADGICIASVSAFQDASCGGAPMPIFQNAAVGLNASACYDTSMPLSLGSISAGWLAEEPGSCVVAGGEAIGEAVPRDPSVFCCEPLVVAAE
ncbi:hypothetical protein [Polyangium mundeleinium]|uniref:Uncharacterized protein n=1 Tax=Polyangium mundeleinium TaxID=2995306 RepID=A0ABT5F7K8_9BACT|nr:hypothetical protein [Polyangium mundeleinium]MDC0749066.1 hypothetical protein [Polyangium mundeleinium]